MDFSKIIPLFIEGVMTFFSPCVLPIIPLYVSYLTSSSISIDEQGNQKRNTGKFILLALCFICGLSVIFILAAFSSSLIASLLNKYELIIQYISSFIIILFALFYLHVIDIPFLAKTRNINADVNVASLNYASAFLLGFLFTFSWTPCIGPMLGFAISTGISGGTSSSAFIYVLVYASGFILMFILLALFSNLILKLLNKVKKVMHIIIIVAGCVMLFVGCQTFYNAAYKTMQLSNTNNTVADNSNTNDSTSDSSETVNEYTMDTLNFTLLDKDGNQVSLTDYKGKKTVVVFFGTWCTYCRQEIPALQEYVNNHDDLNVLLISHPDSGINDETVDKIDSYINENGFTLDYVYDSGGTVSNYFTQGSFPSNWFFNSDGTLLGTVSGAFTIEQLESIVENQME